MKLNFASIIKHHLTVLISGLLTFTLVFQIAFCNVAEAATMNNSIILAANAEESSGNAIDAVKGFFGK